MVSSDLNIAIMESHGFPDLMPYHSLRRTNFFSTKGKKIPSVEINTGKNF